MSEQQSDVQADPGSEPTSVQWLPLEELFSVQAIAAEAASLLQAGC